MLAMLNLFAGARDLRCTLRELDVYNANRELVDSLLMFRYPEEIVKINNLYTVPREERERMEFFIKNREFKYICQEILYKDSLAERVAHKLQTERKFRLRCGSPWIAHQAC